jgi:hypothetical protein
MPRRSVVALAVSILAVGLAVTAPLTIGADAPPPASSPSDHPVGADPAEEGARGGSAEAAEQAESTGERVEAYERAVDAGLLGAEAPSGAHAPGWSGEQVVDPKTDDWEPAIATDPNGPWVYLLVTRYGQPKPCPGNCPTPYIGLTVSKDGAASWNAVRPLCACKGSGQFDPIIEVVPDTGAVYALYMNGYNVVFVKSTDHGKTWSAPVKTYGKVSWGDKPGIAVSDDGRDVYASFNGPQGGDPWIVQSHDFGRNWAQQRVVGSKRYFFNWDADVLHDGTVVFSQGSITYTAPGANPEGVIRHHAFISRDRGTTWENVVVDRVAVGEPCADCRADYYIGQSSVTADDRGSLTYAYDAATEEFGPQRIYVRRSTDGGRTWSDRIALSELGENAASPAVESTGQGDVRLWYMQTAGGDDPDLWNVWYRSSTDGGRTWSAPVKISDKGSGAFYKTSQGFAEPYGDYGEMGITSTGRTIAAWGEGASWIGPGGVWVNRQL